MTTTDADLSREPSGALSLWAGRILSGLFVAFMLFDVGIKLARSPMVEQTLTDLGYPAGLGFPIGVLELIILVLYVIPRTAVLGAVLMMGVLGGAVATHVRAESPLFSHVLFGVYMGVVMWAGLYLRDARLRAAFPIRR